MGLIKAQESEIVLKGKQTEINFAKKALKVLPLREMGLEIFNDYRRYVCKMGTFNSIEIFPKDKKLHSIWIPQGAENIYSTEDYQAFTLNDVDYYIYRRPKNHIRKVIVC